ncbi:MAG: preprotein translocase subunit SecE [Pseudomonadota bacterium]
MVESGLAADNFPAKSTVSSPPPSAPEKKRRPMAMQQSAKTSRVYPGREYLEKMMQFLREVKVELRKVTWPSRKQTVGSTVVVIVLVMIVSLFLGVVDIGLSKLAQVLLQ